MSLEESNWIGKIVVRTLGKDVEPDYEQHRKPKAKTKPGLILGGNNTITAYKARVSLSENNQPLAIISDKDCMIRIEVFLSSKTSNDVLSFNMARKGGEPATACLRRLELSLLKKILKKKNNERKKKKSMDFQSATKTISSVPMAFPDSGEKKAEVIDTSGLLNSEFWLIGLKSRLSIHVAIDQWNIPFAVECNPPTIIGVSMFEDFESKIFLHVPLVVQVETIICISCHCGLVCK